MNERWQFRFMQDGEAGQVSDLVMRSFKQSVAPLYEQDGIQEFARYAQPEALDGRRQSGHWVMVAEDEGRMTGMIEVRNDCHVSMLYVEGDHQHQGVARELVQRALEVCLQRKPDLSSITVNSSPNAVHIYEKLGFQPTAPERVKNGIRYIPMVLQLHQAPGA